MNFQEIASYASGCLRDIPPPCSCACPFGLDVRDLVPKVRKGRYGSIWRTYRDAVLFPSIVSTLCPAPCRKACVRAVVPDGGGAVDLKKIEQGIVAKAERRPPVKYAVPQKPERVAVVGAGLSGLACAWRLGSKGYRVTLYEASSRVGGSVRGLLADEVGDDKADEIIAADIDSLFHSVDHELRLGKQIADIGNLKNENAAVYVATGRGGVTFELLDGWDDRTLASATPGVFTGGSLTLTSREPNVADSIENGLRAASSIEEFLKIGRNEGMGPLFNRTPVNEKFYALKYDFDAEKPTGQSEPPDAYVAEAFRCPSCNCSRCIDACELIRYFKQNPKRIAADLSVTVLPVDEKIKHVASRMLNSCNLCGLCTSVCPTGVDTCAAMYASRHILKESGHLPAAYHDFWMEDMAFSQSEEAYTLVAPKDLPTRLLFFPGCQLAASLPEAVARTFDFLRRVEPEAAMLLSCCGVPADWAGEQTVLEETLTRIRADWESLGRPEFLYACSTCKKTFERHLPEAKGVLVYEWLLTHGEWLLAHGAASMDFPRGIARVYDPCASRDDAAGQAAVRALARKSGFDIVANGAPDGNSTGENDVACCGFGGHIYPANPDLLEQIIQKRTQNPESPYITYCANCRDLFLSKGKDSLHILGILFPPDASGAESERRLPTLTERRENRRTLKAKYAIGENVPSVPPEKAPAGASDTKFDLKIPAELEGKMNRLLLLREDVASAIAHCEAEEGARVFSPASGHSIGSHRLRLVTVWVEYELVPGTNQALVYNVYSHRMRIAE